MSKKTSKNKLTKISDSRLPENKSYFQVPENEGDLDLFEMEGNSSYHNGSSMFIFRMLTSIIIVFAIAILFKTPDGSFTKIKNELSSAVSEDYQFAHVSSFTQKHLGSITAFLPVEFINKIELNSGTNSTPVSGAAVDEVTKSGDGVIVMPADGMSVSSVENGVVTFAGDDPDLGLTVIVQSEDGSSVWYGELESVTARVYQHLDKGDVIGKAPIDSGYYMAVENNGEFLNPMKVLGLE